MIRSLETHGGSYHLVPLHVLIMKYGVHGRGKKRHSFWITQKVQGILKLMSTWWGLHILSVPPLWCGLCKVLGYFAHGLCENPWFLHNFFQGYCGVFFILKKSLFFNNSCFSFDANWIWIWQNLHSALLNLRAVLSKIKCTALNMSALLCRVLSCYRISWAVSTDECSVPYCQNWWHCHWNASDCLHFAGKGVITYGNVVGTCNVISKFPLVEKSFALLL